MKWTIAPILIASVCLVGAGCDSDVVKKEVPSGQSPSEDVEQEQEDTVGGSAGDASAGDTDTVKSEDTSSTGDSGSTEGTTGAPEGYATVTFAVDDSANKTYENGQMRWTGSFVWEEASNSLTYAASWLPEDGPYPPLYDDGPRSEGGHEREGATAGDSIFTTEVYVLADSDLLFEYGLLNEFDNWIWVGGNGILEIPEGSTEVVTIPTMVMPSFGDVDGKLTLDINALQEDFAGAPVAKVFVKGTMNSWAPVQILDNGKGEDAQADDGIFTYHHLSSLGPHDGGLSPGSEVQFVFMLALNAEDFAEDALEYKSGGDALPDGVKAYTDANSPGEWAEVAVTLATDSKGKTMNTAFIVPGEGGGEPECVGDEDCPEGEVCTDSGTCEAETVDPGCETDGDCDPGFICMENTCVEEPAAPCETDEECDGEWVCLDGQCTAPVPPLSEPDIFYITPDSGSKAGGIEVSVLGENFEEGASVLFDGIPAEESTWVNNGELTCITPASGPGVVSVTVTNPDGGSATFASAFTYLDEDPPPTVPTIQTPSPATVGPEGGTEVTVKGWVLDNAVGLKLDGESHPMEWKNGSLTFVAPAHPLGTAVSISLELDGGVEIDSPYPLQYGMVATPTLDGEQGAGEWPAEYLIGTNTVPTAWGEGKNELFEAFAAYDETHLYLGFSGRVEGEDGTPINAFMVYLDRDLGTGTGVTDCITLEDNSGSGDLDDALSGTLLFTGEGFGADLAVGTIGMNASIEGQEPSPFAGWRLFDDLTNFNWLQGTVISGNNGWFEMAIPYSMLFPGGSVPSGGASIGGIALIGNSYGNSFSNQSIPESSEENISSLSSVMTFELLEVER